MCCNPSLWSSMSSVEKGSVTFLKHSLFSNSTQALREKYHTKTQGVCNNGYLFLGLFKPPESIQEAKTIKMNILEVIYCFASNCKDAVTLSYSFCCCLLFSKKESKTSSRFTTHRCMGFKMRVGFFVLIPYRTFF